MSGGPSRSRRSLVPLQCCCCFLSPAHAVWQVHNKYATRGRDERAISGGDWLEWRAEKAQAHAAAVAMPGQHMSASTGEGGEQGGRNKIHRMGSTHVAAGLASGSINAQQPPAQAQPVQRSVACMWLLRASPLRLLHQRRNQLLAPPVRVLYSLVSHVWRQPAVAVHPVVPAACSELGQMMFQVCRRRT